MDPAPGAARGGCSEGGVSIEARQFAELAARIAADKKAKDIMVLDVANLLTIVDYFVICTGLNARQVRSIADDIDRKGKEHGVKKLFINGTEHGKWVCLDFADVVIHVMLPEQREYYALEHLWGDAARLSIAGVTDVESTTVEEHGSPVD